MYMTSESGIISKTQWYRGNSKNLIQMILTGYFSDYAPLPIEDVFCSSKNRHTDID